MCPNQSSGIDASQVYALNRENVLKQGWVLTDAEGTEVQRVGKDAFGALGDPVRPKHEDGFRTSYMLPESVSQAPADRYYSGGKDDIGTPGYFKEAAPAAPKLFRVRYGTWGTLKVSADSPSLSGSYYRGFCHYFYTHSQKSLLFFHDFWKFFRARET